MRVNQTKLRKNPDPWHDVVIPGLEGRDAIVTVPGEEVRRRLYGKQPASGKGKVGESEPRVDIPNRPIHSEGDDLYPPSSPEYEPLEQLEEDDLGLCGVRDLLPD